MKVDVLTVSDVEIKKWRWWSNWIDVAAFNYGGDGYLLQMKVSRTNSKKFRAVAYKAIYNLVHASINEAGDLTQMARKIGGE